VLARLLAGVVVLRQVDAGLSARLGEPESLVAARPWQFQIAPPAILGGLLLLALAPAAQDVDRAIE
jgi:hypothetical protein